MQARRKSATASASGAPRWCPVSRSISFTGGGYVAPRAMPRNRTGLSVALIRGAGGVIRALAEEGRERRRPRRVPGPGGRAPVARVRPRAGRGRGDGHARTDHARRRDGGGRGAWGAGADAVAVHRGEALADRSVRA